MFAFLLIACVGRGHHEVVVMQLDATRTALSAQQVAARDETTARAARIAELEGEISARQAQLDLLEAKHAAHDTDLLALRERYAALVLEDPAVKPPIDASVKSMTAALAVAAEQDFESKRATERYARVETAFAPLVDAGYATVERRGDASVVILLAAKVFNEGTIALSPRGEDIAMHVAKAMEQLHGWDIEVQGHTDSTPFHTPELPSNWELGFGRAVLLLRALREAGVDEPAHVSSYADTAPRVPPTDPEATRQNARVELWLTEIPGIEHRFAPTPPEAPKAPAP